MSSSSSTVSSISSISSSSSSSTLPGNDQTDKKKIAFMITTSMKQDLQETLGYPAEDIKKITPLQASLILNHKVPPEEFQERLPILEREYEEEQEKQRQQEIEEQEAKMARQTSQQESQPEQEHQDYTFTTTSSSFTPTELASSLGIESGFSDTWYEVVEVKPHTGERVRQGLYPNPEEAQLGLETRVMIRERQREKDKDRYGNNQDKEYSTFEVCEISREKVLQQQEQES
mmetsp:Transcript_9840/g.17972  ORF Transcript_9840/g.17972 Transcript_9840/m.17972 type:complete len:231 (-) Transcript_9840:61-753(-)